MRRASVFQITATDFYSAKFHCTTACEVERRDWPNGMVCDSDAQKEGRCAITEERRQRFT